MKFSDLGFLLNYQLFFFFTESRKLRATSRNIALPPVPSAKVSRKFTPFHDSGGGGDKWCVGLDQCNSASLQLRDRIQLPPIPEDEGCACVEVVALYNYTARKPGELNLVKGNRYVSLQKASGDWWEIKDTAG